MAEQKREAHARTPWPVYRMVLVVGAVFAVIFALATRFVPLGSQRARAAAQQVDAGPPSFGRVRIPFVPRDAVATLDGDPIAPAAQAPAPDAVGCWRFVGGADGGAGDTVRCRLPSEEYHTLAVRQTGQDPDSWFVAVPLHDGESVLVH